MRSRRWFGIVAAVLLCAPAGAAEIVSLQGPPATALERLENLRVAQRRTCKSVSSCEEAVRLWCGGYSRADGDNDGIPCENVCRSLAQVEEIKAQIGC